VQQRWDVLLQHVRDLQVAQKTITSDDTQKQKAA